LSIFSGDVIIKTAIELGLQDLKNNIWVLDDIFSDFIDNPLLSKKYGQQEIQNAKDFLKNNRIHVVMAHRLDKEDFPSVTIAVGNSNEDKSLSTLGDLDVDSVDYSPEDIGKPIAWIMSPFDAIKYNNNTGYLTIPDNKSFKYVSAGMLLVDTETGNAWPIVSKTTGNIVILAKNTDLGSAKKFGIAPQYRGYRAKRERIVSQESYTIGCHAHGDTSNLLFLFAFVKYALLRYREGLLEHNNFQLSNLQCSEIIKNNSFDAENIFSRFITLTGQAEESWIKTPMRTIEDVDIYDGITQTTGIKVISQDIDPNSEEAINDLWVTVSDPPIKP
jgi:hypothetical protein